MSSKILLPLLFNFALGLPRMELPINSQVPPVAVTGNLFSFQFAPTTFMSTDSASLDYSLQNGPHWLSVDSVTQTLSGRPSADDLGSISFGLVATDSTGFTVMPVALVIVESVEIQPVGSITDQLAGTGPLSDLTTLALYTGASFNIQFLENTFTGASNLSYYATSIDRSPLPSWVDFNPTTLAFSGSTPPLMSSPQTFSVALFATTVIGFAEASVTFSLAISNHRLVFEPLEQDVNVTEGAPLSFTLLRSQLVFDGRSVTAQDMISATAQLPQWLHLDSSSLILSGDPPPGTVSEDVSIIASDIYGNNANTYIHFYFQSAVFRSEIGILNATIGKPFSYTISRSLFVDPNADINVDLGAAASWLTFNETTLTLRGVIPASVTPTVINASVTVSSTRLSTSETQLFEICLLEPGSAMVYTTTQPGARSSPTSTPSALPTVGSQSSGAGNVSKLHDGVIAGIVIACVLFVASVLAGLLCCLSRKSRTRAEVSNPHSPSIFLSLLPRTIWRFYARPREAPSQDIEQSAQKSDHDTIPEGNGDEKGAKPERVLRRVKNRISGPIALDHHDEFILAGTSLDPMASKTHTPHHSMQIATDMARDNLGNSPTKRRNERLSRLSQRSSGLPTEQRRIGLGHGRPTSGSPIQRYGSLIRNNMRTSSGCASYIDQFPPPASKKHSAHNLPLHEQRMSIRQVVDSRPLDEKRQSFIRHRASSTQINPFMAAGAEASRESTYSKRTPFARHSSSRNWGNRLTYRIQSHSSSLGAHRSEGYWAMIRDSRHSSFRGDDDSQWENVSSSRYSEDEDDRTHISPHFGLGDEDQKLRASGSIGLRVNEEIAENDPAGKVANRTVQGIRVSQNLRPRSRRRQPLLSITSNRSPRTISAYSWKSVASRQRRLTSGETAGSNLTGNAFL